MGAGQGASGRGRNCCVYPSKYILYSNVILFSLDAENMIAFEGIPSKYEKARLEISCESPAFGLGFIMIGCLNINVVIISMSSVSAATCYLFKQVFFGSLKSWVWLPRAWGTIEILR